LAGKSRAIKPDLVIAEAARQSHIATGRTAFQFNSSCAGTALHGLEVVMAWLVLLAAGLLEIGWAIGLKYTEGFTRLLPSVLTLAAMVASIILLGLALKSLPIGTAYAVWTGIGAVGTAILGIALFGEPATAARLASIGLIVAGIVGLKLVT
jgi:quaternary ammonium compound-resistance protein SugE